MKNNLEDQTTTASNDIDYMDFQDKKINVEKHLNKLTRYDINKLILKNNSEYFRKCKRNLMMFRRVLINLNFF